MRPSAAISESAPGELSPSEASEGSVRPRASAMGLRRAPPSTERDSRPNGPIR
jgi:hypothetical protein